MLFGNGGKRKSGADKDEQTTTTKRVRCQSPPPPPPEGKRKRAQDADACDGDCADDTWSAEDDVAVTAATSPNLNHLSATMTPTPETGLANNSYNSDDSPQKRSHRRKRSRPAVKSEKIDMCCLCGKVGVRNHELTTLSPKSQKSALQHCVAWQEMKNAQFMDRGFAEMRELALNLLAAISANTGGNSAVSEGVDEGLEGDMQSCAADASNDVDTDEGAAPPTLWKHISCLDRVRHVTNREKAAANAAKNACVAQEGSLAAEDERSEDDGAGEASTRTPTTRIQTPTAKDTPGRSEVCAVCGITRFGDVRKVNRVCEEGAMNRFIAATKHYMKDAKSKFHHRSFLIHSQYIQDNNLARGTITAKDMMVHNNCRLRYCDYGEAASEGQKRREERTRVYMRICKFIRDVLVTSGKQKPRFGMKVSETYPLYEEVYGCLPGDVAQYREEMKQMYNEHFTLSDNAGSGLMVLADGQAKTAGYYFCLERSQNNALLTLCKQEAALHELSVSLDNISASRVAAVRPTVQQSLDVAAKFLRASFSAVEHEEGVTTAAAVTRVEAERCAGGRAVIDFLRTCVSDADDDNDDEVQDNELHTRLCAVGGNLHFLATRKPGVIEEALALTLGRLASGKVVDVVASLGHCVDARKARQLKHTLAESEVSGTKQMFDTVAQMKADGKSPVVLFSVDNKDFKCSGTVDGSSVHFLTLQSYVLDATEQEGPGSTPVRAAGPTRIKTKLSRRAPIPEEFNPTPFRPGKCVPPGLDEPCTGSAVHGTEHETSASMKGVAWAATSAYLEEEGGVDFKVFEAGASKGSHGVKDLIFELPTIDYPPRSAEGINAAITRILSYLDDLGQESCIVFCDGVEYADLATRVHNNEFLSKKIFLALGGFHLLQAVMAATGKVFRSAGLESMVVDSGVLGETTCSQSFNCSHWNRAFRLHSMLYEVLSGDLYAAYVDSLGNGDREREYKARLEDLRGNLSSTNPDTVATTLSSDVLQEFHTSFRSFIKEKSALSGNFKFYADYLDVVGDMLHYVRVSRDYQHYGLASYIAAMETFQPILAAADRYARCDNNI